MSETNEEQAAEEMRFEIRQHVDARGRRIDELVPHGTTSSANRYRAYAQYHDRRLARPIPFQFTLEVATIDEAFERMDEVAAEEMEKVGREVNRAILASGSGRAGPMVRDFLRRRHGGNGKR